MTVFDRMFAPDGTDGRFSGVAVGVVTNVKDPDGLGRVKVTLPWLADESETPWARIAVPMAGKGRGLYFLPEVDDEVLVAFEHGSPQQPYVIGALWNGVDTPPDANKDGKNDIRMIRSRSGHTIRLVDTDGAEKIEIVDRTAKNSIVIDAAANTIVVSADADVTIRSATGTLALQGADVEITAKSGLTMKAGGKADLTSDGALSVKGRIVSIN